MRSFKWTCKIVLVQTINAGGGGWRYNSTHSEPHQEVEVSGQIHAWAVSLPETQLSVRIE